MPSLEERGLSVSLTLRGPRMDDGGAGHEVGIMGYDVGEAAPMTATMVRPATWVRGFLGDSVRTERAATTRCVPLNTPTCGAKDIGFPTHSLGARVHLGKGLPS